VSRPIAGHLYYDVAVSLCATCHRRVDAKVVFRDGDVLLLKRCPEHGPETVLVADDVDFYRRARELFLKPSDRPLANQTPTRFGCPYDCGLCPDHEQHSCVTLIEICDHCNLECPVCYASSGPARQRFQPLERVEAMLDAIVASEGEPDVVQISGGEPTLHPQFFEVLDAARRRPVRHLMVNTNGLRIASDAAFAERLASYAPAFEVYLQFDSLEAGPLVALRGRDLRDVRRRALERLNALGLSTTLVVTLRRGLNEGEVGRIVDFALEQPCVRGVTFQPVQEAGRCEGRAPGRRLTLTEVRRLLLEQTDVFRPEDVLPVPCHPDCIAMAYAHKTDGRPVPLTGLIDPAVLIAAGGNTITYERDDGLRERLFAALSTGHSPASGAASLRDLLCCLPDVGGLPEVGYERLFRVVIMRFMDAHDFDLRSIKKSCVHVVHPEDHRILPLETYNLFYRDDLERTRLEPLRRLATAPLPRSE
jgi:uncharacterized radical SAM superfamily Fe-S cluster-containing enzyme